MHYARKTSSLMGLATLTLAVLALATTPTHAQTFTTTQNEFVSGFANQGWYGRPGDTFQHIVGNQNYLTGDTGSGNLRSFFSFDLSSLDLTGKEVTGATFTVQQADQPGNVTLTMYDVSTSAQTLATTSGNTQAIYDDLGAGNSYGSFAVSPGSYSDYLSFSLNTQALTDITQAAGGFFSIGNAVTSSGYIYGGSWGGVTSLTITTRDAAPAVPEPSSIAVFAFTGLGAMALMVRARRRKITAAV